MVSNTGPVTRRRAFLSGTALLAAGMSAGCLGDSDESETVTDTIDVWGWDIAAQALKLTAQAYEQDHDEAVVSVTEFERPAMKEEFRDALSAGEGAPAVAMLESVDAPADVASPGGIRDLSSRIEEAGLREEFTEGAWESIDVDDGTYAVPWDIGPVVLYYRRSIYDDAGIDPTTFETWDDFRAAGEQLPDDIALINIPDGDINGQWRTLCRQQGMTPITEDGKINIASEESRNAATLLDDLHEAGLTTRLQGFTDPWSSAYEGGEIASLLSASWMVGTMQEDMEASAGDWGVVRIPAFEPGGRRASNWGGSNLVIPEQVSDPTAELAWEYITWSLAREEMQVLMFEQEGLFPTLQAAYDDPVFEEELPFFRNQPVRKIFVDVAEEIPGWRFSTATPAISQAVETEFERMFDGEHTPEEAVQAAAETVADESGREVA